MTLSDPDSRYSDISVTSSSPSTVSIVAKTSQVYSLSYIPAAAGTDSITIEFSKSPDTDDPERQTQYSVSTTESIGVTDSSPVILAMCSTEVVIGTDWVCEVEVSDTVTRCELSMITGMTVARVVTEKTHCTLTWASASIADHGSQHTELVFLTVFD